MAESLHNSADSFAALGSDAQAVLRAAQAATEAESNALLSSLQESARNHPSWQHLADHIEVWYTEDGITAGITHPDHIDAAIKAEYGDKSTPPAPLFRTIDSHKKKVFEASNNAYREHLGVDSAYDY